jgi:hypothetical protein
MPRPLYCATAYRREPFERHGRRLHPPSPQEEISQRHPQRAPASLRLLSSASAPCCPAHDATSLRITESLASGSQRRPQVIPKPTPRSRESDLPPRCRASQGCTKIAKSVPAPRESKKPGRTLQSLHPLAHLDAALLRHRRPALPSLPWSAPDHRLPRRSGRRPPNPVALRPARIRLRPTPPRARRTLLRGPRSHAAPSKRSPLATTATSTPSPTPRQMPSQPCRSHKVTPAPAPTRGFGPKPLRSRYVALRRWTS